MVNYSIRIIIVWRVDLVVVVVRTQCSTSVCFHAHARVQLMKNGPFPAHQPLRPDSGGTPTPVPPGAGSRLPTAAKTQPIPMRRKKLASSPTSHPNPESSTAFTLVLAGNEHMRRDVSSWLAEPSQHPSPVLDLKRTSTTLTQKPIGKKPWRKPLTKRPGAVAEFQGTIKKLSNCTSWIPK